MLYLRALLKTSRQQLARATRLGFDAIPDRIVTEVAWLGDRIEPGSLRDAAVSADLSITEDELVEFSQRANEGRIDASYVREARSSVIRRLRPFERSSRPVAFLRRTWLRSRASRPARRLGWNVGPKRLSPPTPLIAVVGADGSGKTTLATDIHHWLEWKLAAHHVYFGQPKSGLVFRALNKPGGIIRQRESSTAW